MANPRTLSDMIGEDQDEFLRRLGEVAPEKRAAETARKIIIHRTRDEGRDRQARYFRRYAESTIDKKRRKGQQVSPVNLTDSGNMLNRLIVHRAPGHQGYTVQGGRTRRVVEIKAGTREDERKLRFHIAGTRYMPQRDFMGLTSREEQQLAVQFGADVQRIVPKNRTQRVKIRLFG